MRELLDELADGNQFYSSGKERYASGELLPFRISPEPFNLSPEQARDLERVGSEVGYFMDATLDLYENDSRVAELLDRGKPDIFRDQQTPNYMFWRPDLILTEQGFSVSEIETSVFGLALSELLNRGYSNAGFETVADPDYLASQVADYTSGGGRIVYTNKTSPFVGQLEHLAKKVFSNRYGEWEVTNSGDLPRNTLIYRAHYLSEYLDNLVIRNLYESHFDHTLPTLTPQFEEKAIMSFIWDKRFEDYYRSQLGDSGCEFLRSVIPPTWIVGEEEFFAPGMPGNIEGSADLGALPRSKRGFVLKSSGFNDDSSWSQGVDFLQTKSRAEVGKLVGQAASQSYRRLFIVQEFREGAKQTMAYEGPEGLAQMQAKVRLTPYFSRVGSLLTAKATGCAETDFIHGTTESINTAVGVA